MAHWTPLSSRSAIGQIHPLGQAPFLVAYSKYENPRTRTPLQLLVAKDEDFGFAEA